MKLRTRVLLGFTVIFVVVIAAGVFTVNAQRNQLYDQIDARLLSTPLPPVKAVGEASNSVVRSAPTAWVSTWALPAEGARTAEPSNSEAASASRWVATATSAAM